MQEQSRRIALRDITVNTSNQISAMLPVVDSTPKLFEFIESEIPPCCNQPFQNIHPHISRYVDGPSSDGFMSYASLVAIVNNDATTVNFLQAMGVLAKFQTCKKCGQEMKLEYGNKHNWRWVCNRRKNGIACKYNFTVRRGTMFENSHLSLSTFLLIIWHFVHHLSQQQAKKYLDFGRNDVTIGKYYLKCRTVCNDWIYKNWVPLGGKGKTVEIDESYFAGQQKYGKGMPTTWIFPWVFGIVMRGSLLIWLERVVEKSRDYLVPIINKRVAPRSQIHSDKWKAYTNLEEYVHCSAHFSVNHKRHYVDPVTGSHTQTIESSWRHCKVALPDFGLQEDHLELYLGHFMWERWALEYKKDKFLFFLECLAEIQLPFHSEFEGDRTI